MFLDNLLQKSKSTSIVAKADIHHHELDLLLNVEFVADEALPTVYTSVTWEHYPCLLGHFEARSNAEPYPTTRFSFSLVIASY